MEFTIKSGSPEKQRSACVVVGVFDNRKLSLSAELIDRASNGYISEIIRRGDADAIADDMGESLPRTMTVLCRREHRAEEQHHAVRILVIVADRLRHGAHRPRIQARKIEHGIER